MRSTLRYIAALLAAASVTGVIASLIQTQLVLQELRGFGIPVTPAVRAWATLEDVAMFGPVMAGIAVAALLPTVLICHRILRVAPSGCRSGVFAAASVCALWVAFWLMRSVIPMPAIPGTREWLGHLLMSLAGGVGGLVYASLSAPERGALRAAAHRRTWRDATMVAMLLIFPLALFLLMAPRAGDKPAAVDPASYAVQTVATGLNRPWSAAFLPDGRVLLTEMGGRLLAIGPDGASSEISLDGLRPIFQRGGTTGLMDIALDPRFAQNGWMYLTMGYGEASANGVRLLRARLAGGRIEDVRVLFNSTPKASAGNNGGRIAFLPDDSLVLSLGDGSRRREEAQNPANSLGTVIRIDREGRPPADNPFVGRAGMAPEIYSLGHRNPQGIAVDPANGDLLLTEHGPRGGDEINLIMPGGNYGWPVVTGGIDYPFARVSPFRSLPGYQDALLEWTPSIAPAGLAIYNGALFPQWHGDLLVPALKERAVRRVIRDGRRIVGRQLLLAELNERIRDVKVAPDGSVYVLTDGTDAKLLRLTPSARSA